MQELLKQAAFDEGFANAAIIDTDLIPVNAMFRPFCEENLCGKYAVNYSCPPDCGSPEEMHARLLGRKHALVLQTIWQIDDLSDKIATGKAKKEHNAASIRLFQKMRASGREGFIVGASGCALCNPCEIINGKPCRYPDLQHSCMSAYCVFVRKLTEICSMEYDMGDGLLAFFGMIVFD